MIYLSGAIRPQIEGIGFMMTPNMGNKLPPGRIWAADNGRYAAPERYSDNRFLAWLASRDSSLCLFATAPDVVADHKATVELSLPVMPLIRGAGYKAAFVAQDGFDGAPWSEFDALFIGGSTKFKLSQYAAGVVSEANRLGKWTHMGRVNSYERLRYAEAIGCDSVDGTYLKFGPDVNTPKLERWLSRMVGEPQLSLHI